jgi:hypothetical protein
MPNGIRDEKQDYLLKGGKFELAFNGMEVASGRFLLAKNLETYL